jgi:ribosome-associated heat shock protein Hsp15
VKSAAPSPDRASRRLDQWLWFARLVKSRSQAARLCVSGAIAVNGGAVTRARHPVRSGDTIVLAGRGLARKLTVLALGSRRGPAAEARQLYEEAAAVPFGAEWTPLLADEPDFTAAPLSPEARR